jgi:hypothetical protein
MNKETYITYLEEVILSLLTERTEPEADIVSTSELPQLKGYTISPYNLRKEISKHSFPVHYKIER